MSKRKWPNPNIGEVVRLALEKRGAELLQSYLSRGRFFKSLSETDLSQKYLEAMQAWAAEPTDTSRSASVRDIESEYELRGIEPQENLVRAEWEVIRAASDRAAEEMSDEEKEDISLELFIKWHQAKDEQP
jgi:hypothetical protein